MNQKALNNATFTLHRYYIWANAMRVHMEPKVSIYAEQLKSNPSDLMTTEGIESLMYMGYWYGGLYVVVEGWKQLKLGDSEIDALLLSPNVNLLKKYRNGVFHFQKDYFDQRFIGFMQDGQNVVQWVHQLSRAFGRYFLDWHQQQAQTTKANPTAFSDGRKRTE